MLFNEVHFDSYEVVKWEFMRGDDIGGDLNFVALHKVRGLVELIEDHRTPYLFTGTLLTELHGEPVDLYENREEAFELTQSRVLISCTERVPSWYFLAGVPLTKHPDYIGKNYPPLEQEFEKSVANLCLVAVDPVEPPDRASARTIKKMADTLPTGRILL